MSQLKFSSEIIDDALFRSGEPTDGSSDFDTVALTYLNRAYRSLWMGGSEFDPTCHEDWWWLKAESNIILQPSITTGTVTVTFNNSAITFSSGPASSVVGYFFKTNAHSDVFRISTHTAGSTAATLDSVYTGTTSTTAAYRLMKLEYDLASDCLKLMDPMRVYAQSRYDIFGMALGEMDYRYPLSLTQQGSPEVFAQVDEDTVRFNRFIDTTELVRVDYDYMKRPDDLTNSASEEPLVPLNYRHVLSDMTTYFLLVDKDDNRAALLQQQSVAGIKAMVYEHRSRFANTGDLGQIKPRQRGVGRNSGPLRTETGLIIG